MGTSQAKKRLPERVTGGELRLKGVPKRIDDGWPPDDVLARGDDDGNVILEFKVSTASEEGREAHEMLSALSVNNPDLVWFELWETGRSMVLVLCLHDPDTTFILGDVPVPIRVFVTWKYTWHLFEKFAEVVGYGLEISVVGREVNKHRVMSMADDGELDDLSDGEFDGLVSSLEQTMSQEAYVTRIRLRLSSDSKIGELPLRGEQEVIDV